MYLNLDLNFQDHPKTRRLEGILGPMSEILIVRLWLYCGKVHPIDGVMRDHSVAEVEGIIRWRGEPGAAVAAMERVGFIQPVDNLGISGWFVVDWQQHQGHLAALSRRGRENAEKRWSSITTSNASSITKKKSSNAPSKPSIPSNPSKPSIPNQTYQEPKKGGIDFGLGMPYSQDFLKFWTAYPQCKNKIGKGAAGAAWNELAPTPETVEDIMSGLQCQKGNTNWIKDPDFIPKPITWITERRWEDAANVEVDEMAEASKRYFNEVRGNQ